MPVITPLACSLQGRRIEVTLTPASLLARMHGTTTVVEHTTCSYGLDPAMQGLASEHGMCVSATDATGEVRAVERPDHPFFVATLYQPQLRSGPDAPHPIFVGLLRAASS